MPKTKENLAEKYGNFKIEVIPYNVEKMWEIYECMQAKLGIALPKDVSFKIVNYQGRIKEHLSDMDSDNSYHIVVYQKYVGVYMDTYIYGPTFARESMHLYAHCNPVREYLPVCFRGKLIWDPDIKVVPYEERENETIKSKKHN